MGALISIFILVSALVYASLKWEIMTRYGDTTIIYKEVEHYYTFEDSVTQRMDFNVAFGLTAYDGSTEIIEDEDYAIVIPTMHSWGWNEEGTEVYDDLSKHLCRRDEIGLDYYSAGEGSGYPEPKFFKPDQYNLAWFETYYHKMWCLDDSVEIKGNYETVKAQTLGIAVVLCDPEKRSTCKSRQEIGKWLQGKYLITIENNWKFNSNEYDPSHRV